MDTYVCLVCGYEYDPATGDSDGGIAPGTKFEDIPEEFLRLRKCMRLDTENY